MVSRPLCPVYDKKGLFEGEPTIVYKDGGRTLYSYGFPVVYMTPDRKVSPLTREYTKEMFRHIKEFAKQTERVDITRESWNRRNMAHLLLIDSKLPTHYPPEMPLRRLVPVSRTASVSVSKPAPRKEDVDIER